MSVATTQDHDNDLLEAIQAGDVARARLAISLGADVNRRDYPESPGNVRYPAGRCMLECAAQDGHTSIVEILLDAGADVNAQDDFALRSAVTVGRAETAAVLLARGANVHADNDYALRIAAAAGDAVLTSLLLSSGAHVHAEENKALRVAAGTAGSAAVVATLLAHGADARARDDESLRQATRAGHADVVVALIAHCDYPSKLLAEIRALAQSRGHGAIVAIVDSHQQMQRLMTSAVNRAVKQTSAAVVVPAALSGPC